MLWLLLQVTTTCIPLGGQLTCTSNAPQPYRAPPITQVDVAGAIRSMPRVEERAFQEAPITSFQEELARRMGILARQNRCEDAFRLAALAGESELADASRRLCPFQERRQ